MVSFSSLFFDKVSKKLLLTLQARFFKEQDIDEFRECFYLYVTDKNGKINTMNELAVIMRSLGMNPTKTELTNYMKQKNGKMAFSDFLEILHAHTSSKEQNLPRELLQAFKHYDERKRGVIHAKDLRRILTRWGEHLSPKEVDQVFREANISNHGMVNYEEFVKIVCAPVPDYY